MKALPPLLWAATASALLVNVTLSPLDTAFVYSPDPATSPRWTDTLADGGVVRTGAAESGAISLSLALAGMQAVTVYGEARAPGAALLQASVGGAEVIIPMGPFAFSYAWKAGGANHLRLALSGRGATITIHLAEARLEVQSDAQSFDAMPVRTEPFAGSGLNSFYSFQAGYRPQNGLVPLGEWSVAKGPDAEPVAAAAPAGRVGVSIPANTSLAVLTAWSANMEADVSLQLSPPPPWSNSGLTPMSLFANSAGLVRWHVVLDPTERYRLRITLPSFDEKSTGVMLRDMTFWGVEADQAPGGGSLPAVSSAPCAHTRFLSLALLVALVHAWA